MPQKPLKKEFCVYSSGVATAGLLGQMPQLKIKKLPFKFYIFTILPFKFK
jgi:hypothetical protein